MVQFRPFAHPPQGAGAKQVRLQLGPEHVKPAQPELEGFPEKQLPLEVEELEELEVLPPTPPAELELEEELVDPLVVLPEEDEVVLPAVVDPPTELEKQALL